MVRTLCFPKLQLAQGISAQKMRAGLALLLEAHDHAKVLKQDPWEFSLKLGVLYQATLTDSHLRWLLCQGYVAQAVAATPRRVKRRVCRGIANLSRHQASCFDLTAQGIQMAQGLAAKSAQPAVDGPFIHRNTSPVASYGWPQNTLTPRWLADHRELRLSSPVRSQPA